MGADWLVNQRATIVRRILDDVGEVSTGTVQTYLFVDDAGTFKFLQADLATLSTTPYYHSLTYTVNIGWKLSFVVPLVLKGFILYAQPQHSVHGLLSGEEHRVVPPIVGDVEIRGTETV